MALQCWLFATALLIMIAPHQAGAADAVLPATVAGHTYALPSCSEPATDAAGNPTPHLIINLAPILNDRRALRQAAFSHNGDCGLSADVDAVTLSPMPPGAHVRIDGIFIGTICKFGRKLRANHRSHADASLLPEIANRHCISFVAVEGKASGEITRLVKGEIRHRGSRKSYNRASVRSASRAFDPNFPPSRISKFRM